MPILYLPAVFKFLFFVGGGGGAIILILATGSKEAGSWMLSLALHLLLLSSYIVGYFWVHKRLYNYHSHNTHIARSDSSFIEHLWQ